jgi:hypothetical protein
MTFVLCEDIMPLLRQAINDINLYVNPPLTVRKVANALGEGGLTISVWNILQKLEIIKARHLIFSKNSSSNMIEGHRFPTDMPQVIWPAGYDGCGGIHEDQIREAWVFAHYFMWRAIQVMQYLERTSSHRRELWYDGYTPNYGSERTGFKNYSPRGWFGSYDGARFRRIREVIEKVWNERFQSMGWTVKCRNDSSGGDAGHPCYTADISAGHFVFGTLNFCNGWFNLGHEERAKNIIHEVFHWLRIPGTGLWVTDRHDYYVGERVLDYRPVKALYDDLAAFIANEDGRGPLNYNNTTMNNDNYAYFIYILGSSIYNRITPKGDPMSQFPSLTFKW